MRDFSDLVYLDNNATTAVAPEVLEEMLPFLRDYYGNPSSMYDFAGVVGRKITEARERVAALLGARPDEIIFTSCGTESDNTAIRSALMSRPERTGVVTTRVEHPAVKNLCEHLASRGTPVHFLPVDSLGRLDLDQVAESFKAEPAVASIMWANNETGTVFPVEELAQMAHEAGALFHTDAVQCVGKIGMDMSTSAIDMLSLSGHKLHAPKGVGALYVRHGTRFSPFMIGGHQERGRRGGTENVASLVALGKACELAARNIALENGRVAALRDRLERGLLERIPQAKVNGDPEHRLPNTTSIAFEFIEGESILLMLNEHKICASSGSACTSGSLEPSHVLRAMGVPFTSAHGSVRFSLSVYNTERDIDLVIEKLPAIIARLRELSPFWPQDACKVVA
ncbi:MAG: cysteine desulfurase NifS [Gaiellales bacterium]|nr:cysteine desulfurase NifS [Gaiellales bacterium]